MSQNALIYGCGNMGSCIAFAMCKLGYNVFLKDVNKSNLEKTKLKLSEFNGQILEQECKFDIAISSAPYYMNASIAQDCAEKGIPYCDLGGDPHTTNLIHQIGEETKNYVFTDLGLAPGLGNILAEVIYNKHIDDKPNFIKIRVGGLPTNPKGRLKYGISWSIAGLINEYSGDCEIIENGQRVNKQALGDIEHFYFQDLGMVEAFLTKGALSKTLDLMQERDVKNCTYKTIRFPGHVDYIQFLIEDCKLNGDELNKCFNNACETTCEDQVLIHVASDNFSISHIIYHDEIWTAMQKATAFSASAVASILGQGLMNKDHKVLNYSDIPLNIFMDNMNKLGIKFNI